MQERLPATDEREISPREDLELIVEPQYARMYPWWRNEVRVSIRNRSAETQPIIQTGIGAGLSEPRFRLTTQTLEPDGTWVPARHFFGFVCGSVDHSDWRRRIALLVPGEEFCIWRGSLQEYDERFPLQPGRIRILAEYEYGAQPARASYYSREPLPPDVAFGVMRGVAPFRLVAKPADVVVGEPSVSEERIRRDLDATLVGLVRGRSGGALRFHARLTNLSKTATYRLPSSMLTVRQDIDLDGRWDHGETLPVVEESTILTLAPGQTVEVPLETGPVPEGEGLRLMAVVRCRGHPPHAQSRATLAIPSLPPFAIQSKPITWGHPDVRFEIEVRHRREVQADELYRMDEVVAITLRNPAGFPIDLSGATFRIASSNFELDTGLVLEPNGTLSLFDERPDFGARRLTGERWHTAEHATLWHPDWGRIIKSPPFSVTVRD